MAAAVRPRSFLSTPSARRATWRSTLSTTHFSISIHALREEGDLIVPTQLRIGKNFYPRPPRGGRRGLFSRLVCRLQFLSTPSARRATDPKRVKEERQIFLSTPSARRATINPCALVELVLFLSTPSARRATSSFCAQFTFLRFLSTPSARRATYASRRHRQHRANFYPRPPRGGRPPGGCQGPGP